MFSHTDIWTGIDRLADAYGYSASGLAKKAGLDPTSFNKSKRLSPDGKPRWPSTESLSKVLAVTGATMSDFISLIGTGESSGDASKPLNTTRKKEIAQIVAKILIDTKSVLFNADTPFQYTSGNVGPVYVDCRRLISFPNERKTVIDLAAQLLENPMHTSNINMIAGGETAGIPYAAFLAAHMQKPMVYVRKKPKGVGRMAQIEGHLEEAEKPHVLLVEDLQNFGHSKSIFIDALRETGAKVEHFFTIFDYGIRSDVEGINKNLSITGHHLCNWWDVLEAARKHNTFDTKTLDSVEVFLNEPEQWAA